VKKATITAANQKLDWITELSKETCPTGVPEDPEAVRELLNCIVKDVRAACRILSDVSDNSDMSDKKGENAPGLIPTHGGYRHLKSFQVSEILYDGTVIFCDRFISKRSRTHDQMVQAARSGRQNIAEGSMASATSKKTELKLTNVAKASQEELLLDFEDFLRQRKLRQWDKNDPEALAVRRKYRSFPREWFEKSDLSDRSDLSDEERLDPYGIAGETPEVAANILICLANQGIYLIKRQIERLERDFVDEGGFTEKLYRVRSDRRRQQRRTK
jgi:four helix bundle suffix protein